MARQRFQLLEVSRNPVGHRVARISDSKANRTFTVYHRLGRFRHYATDDPVTVRGLRDCAKAALAS